MVAPVDRDFTLLDRGYVRDQIVLANFRIGLRALVDPETGEPFTEDQIQRATQRGSRWWREAEAEDIYGQLAQRRALFLADQVDMETASTAWLEGYHGKLWGEGKLAATGGSGIATLLGTTGTLVLGSTTVPDSGAYYARDPAGKRYQVFQDVAIGAAVPPATQGTASVTLIAIDTGSDTNLPAGTVLTWVTRDPGMAPTCTVGVSGLAGGTDAESDADFAKRMGGNVRNKQAAGNDAQLRAWTRKASNAIEDAFVYPCAMNAGSTVIAITQKRGTTLGPTGRIPSVGTLATAVAYMTPPGSPVVPERVLLVVVPVVGEPTDVVLRLAQAKGSATGWSDVTPFPSYHATTPAISAFASNTDFTLHAPGDATLPGQAALATLSGADAPALMIWDDLDSVWISLAVSSIEDLGGNDFRVILSAAAKRPDSLGDLSLAAGQLISPDMGRRDTAAEALVEYFDELGPGDLFDVETDPRGPRCQRFPRVAEEYSYRAGAVVATRVLEALGGASSDGTLDSISTSTPSYPTNITDGPRMLVCGKVAIYPL